MGTLVARNRVRSCSVIKNAELKVYEEQTITRCCTYNTFSLHYISDSVFERIRHCFCTFNKYACYRIVLDRRKEFNIVVRVLISKCCQVEVCLFDQLSRSIVKERNRYSALKCISWTNYTNADYHFIKVCYVISILGAFYFAQLLSGLFSLDLAALPSFNSSSSCLYISRYIVYLYVVARSVLFDVVCFVYASFILDIYNHCDFVKLVKNIDNFNASYFLTLCNHDVIPSYDIEDLVCKSSIYRIYTNR